MTAAPGPGGATLLRPGLPGPAVIAHGFGNSSDRARDAIAEGADYLEVDLWVHRGRFEARHERRILPLPLLFEKWYLRMAPRHPFGLSELLREVDGRANLFLDLKNGGRFPALFIREAIDEAGTRTPIVASSQLWSVLRSLQERVPEVDAYYSIDVQAKLDLFLSIADRDQLPRGISCRHTLLTESVIARLHERGMLAVAWTVDDIDRARELIGWGIDGITTHKIADMHDLIARE